jgi:hypothetical protein
MSSDTAVPYGTMFSIDGAFFAVVIPTTEDELPRRQSLFSASMFYAQGRAINGFAACIVALRDGQPIPPWCKVTELELLCDTDGNGFLDARISVDASRLPT